MADATDDPEHPDGADELADLGPLAGLLSDPTLWDDPDPAVEESIVAAIAAEAGPVAQAPTAVADITAAPDNVTPISAARRWLAPIAAGVAAALVILGGFALVAGDDDPSGVEVALAGTDLAPDASAQAVIADTPLGTRIVLDVTGLPPAPEGTYYEAWVRQDAEVGVSAGTFHLRGGDGEIELWAGVSTDDYPLITVTIQEEASVESSGRVVLRALLE